MTKIQYRPEIDGLRAIAVFAVIIFHAEFFYGESQLFQGGFFGVDIFFVISGFLITSLIIKEIESTKLFSFLGFYNRRIRRLIPVLVFIFIIFFPFAWFLLLPDNFVDFSKSIIWSNIFLSNFYWSDSLQVYGAESSNLKPFLHTWTLAIEEQFYILYPIILILTYKWFKPYIIYVLITIILLSLYFAETMSGKDPLSSFYLLHTRFWELLTGGLLAFTSNSYQAKEKQNICLNLLPLLGLCLIFYSFFYVEFQFSKHPGLITLIPVMGTALIIAFSNKDVFLTKILSYKLFVYIGLLSYSLYLWHFPLFAFLRIGGYFDTILLKSCAIYVTFILSALSYKYIEQPFRSKTRTPAKVFYITIIICTSIILIVNCLVIKKDGYPGRFNQSIALGVQEMKEYRQTYWESTDAYLKVKDFTKNNFSVVVIGNSWAKDIANSLAEKSEYEINFNGMTGHRCKAITLNLLKPKNKYYLNAQTACLERNVLRFKTELPNTNLVILADNKWMAKVNDKAIASEVLKNIGFLRKYGYQGPVMIISNRPTYKIGIFEIIKEYGAVGDGINKYAQKYLQEPPHILRKQDSIAADFYKDNKIYYYSLVNSLCGKEGCKVLYENMPLYYDKDHLTKSGALFVGPKLVDFIESNIRSK